MKRTVSERNQPSLRFRNPGYTTPPFRPDQTLFRSRSESVINTLIRNNLQLHVPLFNQDQINLKRLFSYEGPRGQFRPHLAGQNQHRVAWPTAMNGFMPGARQFLHPMTRLWRPRSHHGAVINNHSRGFSPRIPSTTRQFQEIQRNATFTGPRNTARSFTSNSKNERKGHLHRNKVFMRGTWRALPEAEQCGPHEFSFSLVTYNILSDMLLYENMFLYEDCSEDALSWECRKNKLLVELLGYDAEILCLQEVDACHYENWFLPKLREAGYTGVFNQRTGGKPDGCAIFFRHAKFTLVKQKLVKYYTPRVHVLDKDNVGIVLLLKANTPVPNTESSFVCIANTHLLFNKKRGDIKLAQLAYLFAEINELAVLSQDDDKKTHCPVILCGDLNSLPYSPLYNFLITGRLDYSARSPAVISGQLGPSVAESGRNARRIHTPLLPWKFGVTADCRWREQRQGNPLGSSTNSRDEHTAWSQESDRKSSPVRPERDTLGPDNAEYRNSGMQSQRQDSHRSTRVDPRQNRVAISQVDSGTFADCRPSTSTNRYSASSRVNDVKDWDSAKQHKPGPGRCNQELREREMETADTFQRSAFNTDFNLDRCTERNRRSEGSRVPGGHTSQPQRQQNRVESCSSSGKDMSIIELNSNGDSHRRTGRQSKRNADIIDLTQDIETLKPGEEPNNSKSSRISIDDSKPSTSDPIGDRGCTRSLRSKTDVVVIDLTGDTYSSSSLNMVEESISEEESVKDQDFRGTPESDRQSNKVDDTRLDTPTASSRCTDFVTEKAEHDQNGTISIPWQFTSVYAHRFPDGSPEVTTCHSKACCSVDYIFYTTGIGGRQSPERREYVQAGKLTLLGRLELMRKKDFNSMQLLPNHLFPSDHLSLQAKFKLT